MRKKLAVSFVILFFFSCCLFNCGCGTQWQWHEAKPATCEEWGNIGYYTLEMVRSGSPNRYYDENKHEIDESVVFIAPLGHVWGEVEYAWGEGNLTCTATRVCLRDETHMETETANSTAVVTAPTCTTAGYTTYTAAFTNPAFETQTKRADEVAVTDHAWGTPTYIWGEGNSTCTATKVCLNDETHIETETVDSIAVATDPTCTEDGYTTYTAIFTKPGFTTQVVRVDGESAVGHAWGAPVYAWSSDNSQCTARIVCENDPSHIQIEETVDSTPVVTNPTCTAGGYTTFTATFTNAAFTTQIVQGNITEATGHAWGDVSYEWSAGHATCTARRVCLNDANHIETENVNATSVVTAPTCTTAGYTTYTATFANTAFTEQVAQGNITEALGHDYIFDAQNGKYVCSRCGDEHAETNRSVFTFDASDSNKIVGIDSDFDGELFIPVGVTEIGSNAFEGNTKITEVYFPNTVETISAYAFKDCVNIEKFVLTDGLKKIGDYALSGNHLYITYDNTLEGDQWTYIPESVFDIGVGAFNNQTTIGGDPISVYSLWNGKANNELDEYGSYFGRGDNPYYFLVDWNYQPDFDYLDSSDPFIIWIHPDNKCVAYNIINKLIDENQDSSDARYVDTIHIKQTIGGATFVSFPYRQQTKVGKTSLLEVVADNKGGFTELELPSYINDYEYNVLGGFTGIQTLTIPCMFSRLGNLFADHGINLGTEQQDTYVPTSLKTINVIAGRYQTKIMSQAFYKMQNITTITIGEGVEEIGQKAFEYCSSLESVIIHNSSSFSIGLEAFCYCEALEEFTYNIECSVDFGEDCFWDTNLESLIISEGSTVGCTMLGDCANLRYVYIPSSAVGVRLNDSPYENSPFTKCRQGDSNSNYITNLTIYTDIADADSVTWVANWNDTSHSGDAGGRVTLLAPVVYDTSLETFLGIVANAQA